MSRKKKPSRQEQLADSGRPVTYREWKDAILADIRAAKLDTTGLKNCRDKLLDRLEYLNAALTAQLRFGKTPDADNRNAQMHMMLQLECLNEEIGDV